MYSNSTLRPAYVLKGTTPPTSPPLTEPMQPVNSSGGLPTAHAREVSKLQQESDELKKANELADLKEANLRAKVHLAQTNAGIADLETELHNLDLLAHRCEDCKRPLNELVDGKVKRLKNANASVCEDCAAARKAANAAAARNPGKRAPRRATTKE